MILQLPSRTIRVRAMYPGEEPHARGLYYGFEIAICLKHSPADQADTLIHECIHAFWEDLRMAKRVTEESAATQLGTALMELFRLNPGLLVLLTAAIHYNQPIVK